MQSEGKQQWRLHLRLLQEQLQDFQAALALALTLNRTLVLPRFWCSCVWAQVRGRGRISVTVRVGVRVGVRVRVRAA